MDQTSLRLRRLKLEVISRLKTLSSGLHQGYFGTPGFDYKGPRNFVPGRDKLSDVDWYNSRRRGKLIAREMEPEVGLRLGLVLDQNAGMSVAAVASKHDTALRVFALLAYAGTAEDDQAGALITATDEVHVGLGHTERHGDLLVAAAASCPAPEGTPHRLHHGLMAYPAVFPSDSVAVVISDFRSPRWREELAILSSSPGVSEVMAIQVVDRCELGLEPRTKLVHWRDPITGRSRTLNGSDADRRGDYAEAGKTFLKDTAKAIARAGASHLVLRTDVVQDDERLVDVMERFLMSRRLQEGGGYARSA